MSVKLKDYRGVSIQVNDDGRFSASFVGPYGRYDNVVNKSLAAVEKAIDASIPEKVAFEPIKVMHVSKTGDKYGSLREIKTPDVTTIAGIERVQEGRGRNAHARVNLLDENGRNTYSGSLSIYDAEVEAQMLQIVEEAKALGNRWDALVDRLTPITHKEIIARVEAATPQAKVG